MLHTWLACITSPGRRLPRRRREREENLSSVFYDGRVNASPRRDYAETMIIIARRRSTSRSSRTCGAQRVAPEGGYVSRCVRRNVSRRYIPVETSSRDTFALIRFSAFSGRKVSAVSALASQPQLRSLVNAP